MKKNFSDISVYNKLPKNKLSIQERNLETTSINNSPTNKSIIQSKILSEKQKQEKEQEKPKSFTYLSHKVQIPIIYYERVKFIRELFNNEILSSIIAYSPSSKIMTTKYLGKYLKQKLKSILEIVTGVIYYLYKCIAINRKIFEKSIKGNSSKNLQEILKIKERSCDEVLQSGVINTPKESMDLFYEICGYAGVRIKPISGLIKRSKYKRGDTLLKHWWCVLNCGIEKNYFIDPLLCIGKIQDNGEFVKELRPFYFLTPPLFFLENHLPNDEIYQLMPRPLKVKEFTTRENLYLTEEFYNDIFKYEIELENRTCPEFECYDSETKIKLSLNETSLESELYLNDKLLPKESVNITNKEGVSNYIIIVYFQTDGEYKLNLLVKTNQKKEKILTYRISVKIKNIINHESKKKIEKKKIVIPKFRSLSPLYFTKNKSVQDSKISKCASEFDEKVKNKCYDNNDAYVFEPRNKILKIGQDAKFKVKVRNAKYVVVLDGKRWNYLKRREDDIWEGIIPIKSENIVVCTMRNNDIYTEVFEFLAVNKV